MLKIVTDYNSEICKSGDIYLFTFKRKYTNEILSTLEQMFDNYFVQKSGKFKINRSYLDQNNNYVVEVQVI